MAINTPANSGRRRLITQALASKGKHGDTMLAHLQPQQAAALKMTGGAGTMNPDTGLPQFYSDPRNPYIEHPDDPSRASGLTETLKAGANAFTAPDADTAAAYRDYGGPLTSPFIAGYDLLKRGVSAVGAAGGEAGQQIGKTFGSDTLGNDLSAILSGEYPGAELPGMNPHPYEDRPVRAPVPERVPYETGAVSYAARRPTGGPRPPRRAVPPSRPIKLMVEPDEPPAPRGHNMPPELLDAESPPAAAPLGERVTESAPPDEPTPSAPAAPTRRRAITSNSLRNLPPDEALREAQSERHLIQHPEGHPLAGQYVGAPRGFTTREHIQQARDAFDAAVERGTVGRYWYDRSQAANTELTGGVPARESLLASEQAHWSPQAIPETNYGFALGGHNAYEMGAPRELVRNRERGTSYIEARNRGELPTEGPKTDPFRRHLDPNEEDPTTGVNDIWHARAFGFTNKDGSPFDRALTAQEHAYLDAETVLAVNRANERALGGHTDWTSGRVQASGWVGKKIESETAKNIAEKGMSPEDAHAKAVEDSRVDFSDVMDKYTLNATHEAVPGAGTSPLANALLGGPRQLREAYSADPRSTWATAPGGRDQLYEDLGLYSRPTIPATGSFTPKGGETEINPAQVARPQVDYVPARGGGLALSQASEGAVRAAEAWRGYGDVQNMSAAHKTFPRGLVPEQSHVGIEHPRMLTPKEMQDLTAGVKPYGLSPSDTGRGVSLLNFGGTPTGKTLPGMLADPAGLGGAVRQALPEAGNMERVAAMTPSIDYQKAFAQPPGSGAATRQLFSVLDEPAPGIPSAVGKLDTPARRTEMQNRLERDVEYGQELGAPQREDVQNARRIVADPHPTNGGLAGLRKALQEGKIPLPAVAGVIGTGAAAALLSGGGEAKAAEPGDSKMPNPQFGAPLDFSNLPASAGMPDRQAVLRQQARQHMAAMALASKGKRGDDILAHISPDEARALKMAGGVGTRNPETGLPQFYGAGDPGSPGEGGQGVGHGGGGYGYGHASGDTNAGGIGSPGSSGGFGEGPGRDAGGGYGGGGAGAVAVGGDPVVGGAANTALAGGVSRGSSFSGDPSVDAAMGGGLGALGAGDDTSGTGRGGYQTGGASQADLTSGGSSLGNTGHYGDPSSGSLGGPAGDTLADEMEKATKAYKDRGWIDRAWDFANPFGMGAMRPTGTNPATYSGGTWHEGFNPGALAGSLAGLASGVPGASTGLGLGLGAAYNEAFGHPIALGGNPTVGAWGDSRGLLGGGGFSAPDFGGAFSDVGDAIGGLGLGGGKPGAPGTPGQGQPGGYAQDDMTAALQAKHQDDIRRRFRLAMLGRGSGGVGRSY